jgi:hypothetical protein
MDRWKRPAHKSHAVRSRCTAAALPAATPPGAAAAGSGSISNQPAGHRGRQMYVVPHRQAIAVALPAGQRAPGLAAQQRARVANLSAPRYMRQLTYRCCRTQPTKNARLRLVLSRVDRRPEAAATPTTPPDLGRRGGSVTPMRCPSSRHRPRRDDARCQLRLHADAANMSRGHSMPSTIASGSSGRSARPTTAEARRSVAMLGWRCCCPPCCIFRGGSIAHGRANCSLRRESGGDCKGFSRFVS